MGSGNGNGWRLAGQFRTAFTVKKMAGFANDLRE
jgi:hypothetical protein